jgi:ferric-dicitrate binding protein FerR (iron transport regulator)
MRQNVILTVVLATAVSPTPSFAASLAIGVATALGTLSVNNASTMGNVDVFDGTQLRTTIAPGDVHLENGVDLRLATRSAGTVFGDHMVLREGAVRVANFASYPVQVQDLQVQADVPGTTAIVRTTARTIEVASIGGTVKVTDGGAMLTRVAAGTKMSFQTQASSPNPDQTGTAPGQTGAAPAPAEKGPISDKKAFLWAAGVCGVGAIVVGSIAAAQGKSPF